MFCHNFCEGGKNNAKTGLVLWFSPVRLTGLKILHPFGAIFGQCQKERDNKSSPLCEQLPQRGRAENNMEKFQKNNDSNAVLKTIFVILGQKGLILFSQNKN